MSRAPLLVAAFFLGACGGPKQTELSPALMTRTEQGPCAVELQLDRDRLTVAERLRLTILTSHPEGYELAPLELEKQLAAWTIAEEARTPDALDAGGRLQGRRTLILEPFLPGPSEVPALRFVLRPRAGNIGPEINLTTVARAVTVSSVLNGAEGGEPAPGARRRRAPGAGLQPRHDARDSFTHPARGARGLAPPANPAPAPPPPPRPAHERALAALDALLARGLLEAGEVRLFFSEMAELLRVYVEERFGLMAPERTTEELLAEARRSALIPGPQAHVLGDFLARCDLVKFARVIPPRAEADAGVGAARRFIEETREAEPQPNHEPSNPAGSAP